MPVIPTELKPGVAAAALASVISQRCTGALVLETEGSISRAVLKDGDILIAASGADDATLVSFLQERGDISSEVGASLARRIPPFGRHAGAALVAHGHLRQDELWTVLRDHAEWLLGRMISVEVGSAGWEEEVPERLSSEPAVFGGAAGAEVFVEVVRRAVPAPVALERLGGEGASYVLGDQARLLDECALSAQEAALLDQGLGQPLNLWIASAGLHDFSCVLYALCDLQVIRRDSVAAAQRAPTNAEFASRSAQIDDLALRERIVQRRALVTESDYFTLLGVSRRATRYDIEQAYDRLKHLFARDSVLTPSTVDLSDDVDLIHDVLDEAFEILGDPVRRERYQRALDTSHP